MTDAAHIYNVAVQHLLAVQTSSRMTCRRYSSGSAYVLAGR